MTADFPRGLADIKGAQPGPTLLVTAGLHGNERGGVQALRQVATRLAQMQSKLRGRFVALCGNRAALALNVRFIRRDLNRGWSPENVERLLACSAEVLTHEDQEQRELLLAQRQVESECQGQLSFVDLHSTSAPSTPFVCFGDTLQNRKLALALPATAILGLEEVIEGAMLGYWADRGHTAIAFEGGQHDSIDTVERHSAMLWLCLVQLGLLDARDVPTLATERALLAKAAARLPPVVEITHRHLVTEDSGFEMRPGFTSFVRVERGQVLAQDHAGPILCPSSGFLLMPRYQGQGEDGFFLAERVAPFWLELSALLRRNKAQRLIAFLPGVARRSGQLHQVTIERTKLSRYKVGVLHLLGYRKKHDSGSAVVFSRRPLDAQ